VVPHHAVAQETLHSLLNAIWQLLFDNHPIFHSLYCTENSSKPPLLASVMLWTWRDAARYSSLSKDDEVEQKCEWESASEDMVRLSGSFWAQYNCIPQSRTRIAMWICLVTSAIIFAIAFPVAYTSLGRNTQYPDPGQLSSQEIFNVTHISSKSKTNDKPHPCGISAAEAREYGCRWDQLTWSWLPASCPSYANELFMSAEETPWRYYQDLQQKEVLDESAWEQVLDGELRVFGERREHMTHCIYFMLSAAQILHDGTPYHARFAEYKHHEHCANMLLEHLRKSSGWYELQSLAGTVSFDQDCTMQYKQ
jgi:hypothetical protein